MKRTYVVDLQFMQTDAYQRGMGRYVQGLLKASLAQAESDESFTCIYTSNLPDTNLRDLETAMQELGFADKLSYVALNLELHDFAKHNYDHAYDHNQTAVDEYLASFADDVTPIYVIACPMQEPVVPVLPSDQTVITSAIWYDLIPYLLYDHYFKERDSAYAHSYLRRINMLLHTQHIFAISLATKMDLIEFISIPGRRISVIDGSINQAIDGAQSKKPDPALSPYFLCPASPEPSKNVLNTIKGFGIFNAAHHNKYHLVITSNYDPKIAKSAKQYAENVTFAGHISSEELKGLYEQCEGLLFASTYEGLGMPILEAVSYGKKVVCSDIPVFQEIGTADSFYWCKPRDPEDIARALTDCAQSKLSAPQKQAYATITAHYTWERSALVMLDTLRQLKPRLALQKTLAVVGPHPASFSTIGKVIGETVPYLLEQQNVHYYFDSGPSDERHGLVHFHHLQAYEHLYSINDLASRIGNYDKVIYHMGTSDHHMKTYLLAKAYPATMILHDTNLGGKGLAGQMQSNGFMSPDRYKKEVEIETQYLNQTERFITSLVSSQKHMVLHSVFSAGVVKDYHIGPKNKISKTNLPIHTIDNDTVLKKTGPIKLGLTGILSDVKGTDMLEWLFQQTDGLHGCELSVFGFGFFVDKQKLFDLEARYPNFKVSFDLTDLEFKQLHTDLDVLINYRIQYHGETSRSTEEAMREHVVPVVRNIGWFAELPDDVCYKLDSIDELPELVRHFGKKPDQTRIELQRKLDAAHMLLKEQFNFDDYIKVLLED